MRTVSTPRLTYCEGWDPWSRRAHRPLPASVARERDRRGEQYTMLLTRGGTPTAVLDVAWDRRACTVWQLDEQLRRTAKYELRRLTGPELVLVEQVRWRYPDAARPEFDAATPRCTRRYSSDGLVHDIVEPYGDRGGAHHRFGGIPSGPPHHPLPPFGMPASWARLAAATARSPVPAERVPDAELPPLAGPPWQAPLPSRPALLARLFQPGTRYELPGRGEATAEVRPVGWLRMPTGRLVAADANALAGAVPLTVSARPGRYPVTLSMLAVDDGPPVVAAVRVLVTDRPVATWELAVRSRRPAAAEGWDAFGFEVTSGVACLLDAAARGPLARGPGLAQALAGGPVCTDDVAGANLVAFAAAPGTYPTWVGRTTGGEVACFVADLMRIPDATVVSEP
ncbi:MAG: DUF4241 domain-containing protein [Micromonosporaceae bacterium]